MSAARLSILVVDDDRLVRSAMVRTLKRVPDVQVNEFFDGASALGSIPASTYDVAVLDLKMPDMDGVELASALRALLPQIRIVFVSADPHGELAQRARALAPVGLLAKPWSPEELVKLLRA